MERIPYVYIHPILNQNRLSSLSISVELNRKTVRFSKHPFGDFGCVCEAKFQVVEGDRNEK